jgi:3-hydroxyisobutyrate dehydrogenase-like beta-hydroxyacid dehydrogenase
VKPTIAIVAMGEMGAGVARALVQHGARVITSLAGRSRASAERAAKAGVEIVAEDRLLVADADFVLSVVPPCQARQFAGRVLRLLRECGHKPVFVDCNAISPASVREIAAPFVAEKLPFVDAGIIGAPPEAGRPGPRVYASGPEVARLEVLRDLGLDVRAVSAAIGEASALKMAYGGINKGLQALGAALLAAAVRHGVGPALLEEMQDSQPAVLSLLTRFLPGMYAKAYRWAGEMEEVARFLEPQAGASEMFLGAAHLYTEIAREHSTGPAGGLLALLDGFLRESVEAASSHRNL